MNMATIGYRFTVADLANMPEDGSRYEVIDGELYVTHAPHSHHQMVIDAIAAGFRAWDPMLRRGVAISGAGVIFSSDDGVIPDLVWVRAEQLDRVFVDEAGERDGKLHAAPDLVVEVLSSGAQHVRRDRETKLKLYSGRGVREYWIADRERRQVEVYRRTDAAVLALARTLAEGDTLTSPMLPGFALPVAQVFLLPEGLAR
jgi:Uma2 family endonuclease